MKSEVYTPTSSQTVGPYFAIELPRLIEQTPSLDPGEGGCIEIRGQVLDRDGSPVNDAVLEFWSPACASDPVSGASGLPAGFRRAVTDPQGAFSIAIPRPAPVPFGDGRPQAPHFLVLIFLRGLLRNLISRVYLSDEPANTADPVLMEVPAGRRATLIAQRTPDRSHCFQWNVVLQGDSETVFFAW